MISSNEIHQNLIISAQLRFQFPSELRQYQLFTVLETGITKMNFWKKGNDLR